MSLVLPGCIDCRKLAHDCFLAVLTSHARRKRVVKDLLNDNVITASELGVVDCDSFRLRLQSGNTPDTLAYDVRPALVILQAMTQLQDILPLA